MTAILSRQMVEETDIEQEMLVMTLLDIGKCSWTIHNCINLHAPTLILLGGGRTGEKGVRLVVSPHGNRPCLVAFFVV